METCKTVSLQNDEEDKYCFAFDELMSEIEVMVLLGGMEP